MSPLRRAASATAVGLALVTAIAPAAGAEHRKIPYVSDAGGFYVDFTDCPVAPTVFPYDCSAISFSAHRVVDRAGKNVLREIAVDVGEFHVHVEAADDFTYEPVAGAVSQWGVDMNGVRKGRAIGKVTLSDGAVVKFDLRADGVGDRDVTSGDDTVERSVCPSGSATYHWQETFRAADVTGWAKLNGAPLEQTSAVNAPYIWHTDEKGVCV